MIEAATVNTSICQHRIQILQMTLHSTRRLPICTASQVNLLSAHSLNVILVTGFQPALHRLSSPWKGNIISTTLQEINFLSSAAVAHVNSTRGSVGFFFSLRLVVFVFWEERADVTKHPPAFIYCVALSEGMNGVIPFWGDSEAAAVWLCVPQGCALGSFSELPALICRPSRQKGNICARKTRLHLWK